MSKYIAHFSIITANSNNNSRPISWQLWDLCKIILIRLYACIFSYTKQRSALVVLEKSYVTQLDSRRYTQMRYRINSRVRMEFRAEMHRSSNSFETSSGATLANPRTKVNRPRSSLYQRTVRCGVQGSRHCKSYVPPPRSCRFLVHKFTCLQARTTAPIRGIQNMWDYPVHEALDKYISLLPEIAKIMQVCTRQIQNWLTIENFLIFY